MSQPRIQGRPPLPEGFYIRIVITSRYRAAIAAKISGIIMRYLGEIGTVTFHFLHPRTTKLRTAIATGKITSIIKIDFDVTRYDIIFIS
jgi:hypothetical protein